MLHLFLTIIAGFFALLIIGLGFAMLVALLPLLLIIGGIVVLCMGHPLLGLAGILIGGFWAESVNKKHVKKHIA